MNDKVAIDIGHAYGTSAVGKGLTEHECCERIAEALKAELEDMGFCVGVVDFPTKTNTADLVATARVINAGGYALSLSLHCDHSENKLAKGAHVIYTSKEGRKVADFIARHLCALMPGRANRTVKKDSLYVLNNTKCVAVLCECGFVTNRENAEMLKSEQGVRSIARSVAVGVREYFNQK